MEGCGWPANPDVGVYIKETKKMPLGGLVLRLRNGVFVCGPIGSFHQQV